MPDDTPNEIVAAAEHVKAARVRAARHERSKKWPVAAIGLGVGIGSAAIAAAMLFANRTRD